MPELEISINNSSNDPEKDLRAVLGNFEALNNARVTCTVYDWANAWAEIMKIMLYKHGPVISQVGTTWLGSLEATQGIRPFKPTEINRLGGASVYHPETWESGISLETGSVMAIPWFLDTYVLYYRKDLLEKAGVDEVHAFDTLDTLAETVQKLAEAGETIPFAMPTMVSSRASMHNLAGWVWNNGGEFTSENGKHLLLSDPKTRQGLKAYFSFFKHMPTAAQGLSDNDCYSVFLDGTAAISLRNASLLYMARHNPAFAPHLGSLGVARLPGVNFIGGSSLILWNHIRPAEERLAMELLREITLPETQYAYFKRNGIIPSRIEALQKLEAEPFYAPVVQALQNGRPFRKFKLWGLIEERLNGAIGQVWRALYAQENPDLEVEMAKILDPLQARLQMTLSDN